MHAETLSGKTLSMALLLFSVTPVLANPQFTNIGEAQGIAHQYVGGWEHYVGGGVATFDCDGDKLPELFIAGGENSSILLRNTTEHRGGALSYAESTPDALSLTGVIGAYPIDIDGDGFQDLMVLRVGENILLRGGDDCSFSPFPASLGFDGGNEWTTAFSATWEQGQTLPTLAVGNYVDRYNPEGPFEACDKNFLFRPDGNTYAPPDILDPGYCPLSMLFSNWRGPGYGQQDLRVSNDRHYYVRGGSEQMWDISGGAPRLHTLEDDNWTTYSIWGMGIASRDIPVPGRMSPKDGAPEIFLTSMGDQKLHTQIPDTFGSAYEDAAFERGITAHRPYMGDDGRASTGWHVAFGDVQNDGLDDIFIAKGNVEQMPSSAMKDPNNLLVQDQNFRFREMGEIAGIGTPERSRGASFTDLNLDGLLDLVVVNRRAPMEIYQNTTPNAGNWLELELIQNGPNINAVGAWIRVREACWVNTLSGGPTGHTREITVGGGHVSGKSGYEHFGLGEQQVAYVQVVWPDGAESEWQPVQTNQILSLTRLGDDFVIALSPQPAGLRVQMPESPGENPPC